ncbi:MAG: CapA family protein [Firmicutes bacterium]|nr:CapA family protein [Bacillota bacterium]
MLKKIFYLLSILFLLCSCVSQEQNSSCLQTELQQTAIAEITEVQTVTFSIAENTSSQPDTITVTDTATVDDEKSEAQNGNITASVIEKTVADEKTSLVSVGTTVIETENTTAAETETQTEPLLPETETIPDEPQLPAEPMIIRLGFAGDFKTAEGETNTEFMDAKENGIFDCISPNLIEETRSFDLFMLNNEFTYSDRGEPMKGKKYTFRAKPERVNILNELGVDLVLLANNHVYDYGEEAFLDTMEILENAGIDHLGAGENKEAAQRIIYYDFGDTVISFIGASRAEQYHLTPVAKENSPGVFGIYDEAGIAELLQLVELAKAESDLCIVSLHWGTEYSNYIDESQQELAHRVLDAGADAIIGSHAHVLQGIEIYDNKPIIYNLGNFWFNSKWLYSGVFELSINADEAKIIGARFIPCTQRNCYTNYPEDEKGSEEILNFMQKLSFDIEFDETGNILYDFAENSSENEEKQT